MKFGGYCEASILFGRIGQDLLFRDTDIWRENQLSSLMQRLPIPSGYVNLAPDVLMNARFGRWRLFLYTCKFWLHDIFVFIKGIEEWIQIYRC